MTDVTAAAVCADLLYREGLYLDRQDWDSWLALYAEDAVFWVPAWLDEHRPTSDPDREISLIYHPSRVGLEERIMRIRTRKSVTALPLPRTVHMVTNILPMAVTDGGIEVTSSWMVHEFDPRVSRAHMYVGRYEHTLRREPDGAWRIARKKVLLTNDMIPTALDFYSV
ncbi:aromatic-ring-hydroxylating dioxygenase subunit beta [Roseomonas xinghualingensis]|uniref:aromatic-ring-hydroxylating dioxygenase subunit beta n=1 Tax=Roseomonas xinghualingensis TaxID=2986475 RepID=UPI0021F2317B|nr:aromatic-ring-hydroxylating dioxygenase subunit beta [Roseomonas sp. SXEYE001]MCV4209731.1 aromatic-ring-hydroxylating dioxygenase subunit beta [Roseomonas sp. SXEYE001]